VQGPVDYDITIAEVGTFAVTVAGGRAYVKDLEPARGRREAEFHLSADPLTLAELIAGVPHKIGRFRGAARVSGRKRRLKPLKAIPGHAEPRRGRGRRRAARAGPHLPHVPLRDPAPGVARHTFTVAQRNQTRRTWYVTAATAGAADPHPPEDGADAP
jgi:hypothetical protein